MTDLEIQEVLNSEAHEYDNYYAAYLDFREATDELVAALRAYINLAGNKNPAARRVLQRLKVMVRE